MQPKSPHRRHGFTLIEMLISIAIVAVLAGLLLTAIGRARVAAQRTAVVSEISNLEKAIADFKLKFGVDIPSSIVLHENLGNYEPAASPNQQTRRSRAILARIWPNLTFSGLVDFNGDGDTMDNNLELGGIECLVFFLGGVCSTQDASMNFIINRDGTAGTGSGTITRWTPLGFSTNPARPFARTTGSRVGPFYEFELTRLVNLRNAAGKMPEYLDSIPGQSETLAYASSTGGSHSTTYRGDDLNLVDVYRRPPGRPAMGAWGEAYNPRGFQLISPGFDSQLGSPPEAGWEKGMMLSDINSRDDIANFADGSLE